MFGALALVRGPGSTASQDPPDGEPGGTSIDLLRDIAADFSPRFERRGNAVVLDLAGLDRLFGHPRAIADELRKAIAEHDLRAHVAIAGTCTAAYLLAAHQSRPVTVVDRGGDADAIAPLPIELLANVNPPSPLRGFGEAGLLATFRRWGLRTLGDLAALPADAVSARLGAEGLRWHRLAHGHDLRPLQPEVPDERFEQAFDLEWPIEGLEPLSFVLGRLLEPLSAHLERRGRGAAVLHLRLHLVTRTLHERSLQLPAAMRDARTLRTLLLLDLESNPPPAAIDRVVVAADPTPARVLQFSLLARPLPSPEQLSTLMARLGALMGEDRCGSPVVVDSWKPGAFAMRAFNPESNPKPQLPTPKTPAVALRRFRVPVPVRVRAHEGTPLHLGIDRRGLTGGAVQSAAGPWRTSGDWWKQDLGVGSLGVGSLGVGSLGVGSSSSWDRDEWDVALGDGVAYRVFRERGSGQWFVEGAFD
jgi:protein ImuB